MTTAGKLLGPNPDHDPLDHHSPKVLRECIEAGCTNVRDLSGNIPWNRAQWPKRCAEHRTPDTDRADAARQRPKKYLDTETCPLCAGSGRIVDPVAAEAHRRFAHPVNPEWGSHPDNPASLLRELNEAADRGEAVDYGVLRRHLR